MPLRCESCEADNPDTNLYCGQCGKRLERVERTASDTPEEFWRSINVGNHPFKHPEASADLPPEVIDFDNQIPMIADNGTDRRLHPPPDMVEEFHEHLDREAELHDQLRHGSEPHYEMQAKQEAEREHLRDNRSDYLRWDTNEEPNAETAEDVREDRLNPSGNAFTDPAVEPGAPLLETHHNFLSEGERTSGTGVSGPSFLGLTDDRAPEYADTEPEPETHLRRNVALAILAAVIILAALQWRSIRDYGLTYVQNGSMQVKQEVGRASQNPPAVAADHTSRDLDRSSATAQTGTSQAVENSPNANRTLPVQQAPNSPPSGEASPASPATPDKETLPAKKIQVAEAPHAKPPAAARSTAKSRPSPVPARARGVSHAAPVAGVAEMNRAASASDAEARAAWLWKAVGKGNPQAPIELAKMYEQGKGVVRSCDQAKVLLRSAAAKGNEQARINLQQIRTRGGCSAR